MALLETPSRIWRRIEADERDDMPSLPTVPAFEDSNDINATTTSEESHQSDADQTSPLQSTPAPSSNQNTIRLQSSTASTARFAQSIASRASRSGSAFSSSGGNSFKRSRSTVSTQHTDLSFDEISAIPSFRPVNVNGSGEAAHISDDGLDEDMSLAEALQSVSPTGSPYPLVDLSGDRHSNSKKYDYSVSLKSEPKVRVIPRSAHQNWTC
ncbi:hypothetical protein BC834DRAFT_352280 [Gloeopeniophorella convolvens]|nr:hypothetical protein BC834DRAFT_352280 [Gloeopeniophorella convolvens]